MKKEKEKKIDFQKLIEYADPEMVFRAVGMQMATQNGKTFLLCPGHKITLGREDRNIGSCVITPKGCYCYACARGYDTIQSVAYFLDIDMPTAAKQVAEICGISDFYADGTSQLYEYRLLNEKELSLIGLTLKKKGYGAITNLAYFDEASAQRKGKEDTPCGICYYVCEPVPFDLRCLALKEPATYRWLVLEKTKEASEKYQGLYDALMHPTKHLALVQALTQAGIPLQEIRESVKEILFDLKMLSVEFGGND